jgi:hypothetical protein
MKDEGSVLAVISDSHIGSSTALAPLEFTVHNRSSFEAQKTQANKLQNWLHECWLDYWQYVFKLAKHRRLIVVHCGDLVDGVHHGSTQVMAEVGDQVEAALELLMPIRSKAQYFFGILGTGPVHAGMDNATEAQIYKELGATDYSQTLTLEIDGKVHDFAHHGRAGRRPWTSSAAGVAAEVMIDYASQGLHPPAFVWRGHNHVIDDSGSKLAGTRSIALPSWQLKTSFGWRMSANTVRSDIGGYIVVNGVIDDSKARYSGQPDGRRIICL